MRTFSRRILSCLLVFFIFDDRLDAPRPIELRFSWWSSHRSIRCGHSRCNGHYSEPRQRLHQNYNHRQHRPFPFLKPAVQSLSPYGHDEWLCFFRWRR